VTTTLRARFDGTALIPLDPVDLPVGTEVDIELRPRPGPAPGSPAALLRVMAAGPRLEPGDIEALEREIAAGRQTPRAAGAFDSDETSRP
jgi:hypothetical protein